MTFLPAMPSHFADGDAIDPDPDQRVFDLIQLERLNNRFDFLHGFLAPSGAISWDPGTQPIPAER